MAQGPRRSRDQVRRQIAAVQRRIASGATVRDACAAIGLNRASYYRWIGRARANAAPPQDDDAPLRREIVAAATTLFLEEGFGASITKVAHAAHVSRRRIHALFRNKDRLFGEVVQTLHQRSVAPLAALDPGAGLPETLTEIGRHLQRATLSEESVGLLRITLGEYRHHPQLADVAYALRSQPGFPNITTAIARRLEEEMQAGRIDPVDPRRAAEAFMGSFTAHARHRMLIGLPPPTPAEFEQSLAFAVTLFVRGLGYREKIGN